MRLSSREDINAPIQSVFDVLTDFDMVERIAARRGVDVARTQDTTPPAPGMAWEATFAFRGKPRSATIVLQEMRAPDRLLFRSQSGGLETDVELTLMALSPEKTRMTMKSDLNPKTLPARLLVQSLKLAKGSIEKRLKTRMADAARMIETRARDLA